MFPEGKVKFHLKALMMAKVASKKGLVKYYSYEIFGIYEK